MSLESITGHSACRRKAFRKLLSRKPLPPALRKEMLCKRCQLTQCLSALKVEAGIIGEDSSTVGLCQLVTSDQNRGYFFLISILPAIWEQVSVKEQNPNHDMLTRIPAPLPEPHVFKAESIVGIEWSKFIQNRLGNNGNSDRLYFGGLQNHCRW